MKKSSTILLLLFLLLAHFQNLYAQNKYALLIGINNFIKPDSSKSDLKLCRKSISDLTCCENNVTAVNQILINRFGFQKENVQIILNKDATRDEIFLALYDMNMKCQKGDVFFFYYAGHGSQINNRLSPEPDKLDETIVPADGIYAGKDIRDKEIGAQLQSFINKGALVTAMFECCHSGSMARGLGLEVQKVEVSEESIADENIYPKPEKNGALIIGACQDFQLEVAGPFPPDGVRYSFFTKAFIEVMKKNEAGISANNLVNSITAQFKNWGQPLVPSIAGNNERLNQPLFGGNTISSSTQVIVQKVLADKSVILQGGSVLGLENGVELTNQNKTIKLEIVKSDLSSATAKVIYGNSLDVKSGSFFTISRYVYSGQNKLHVSAPMLNMKRKDFFQLTTQLNQLFMGKKLLLKTELNIPVDYWLYYNNSKWYLNEGQSETDLGAILNMDSLRSKIQEGKTIRLQLPVYTKMYNNIKSVIDGQYSCVNFSAMGTADYTIPTLISGQLNYELVKTNPDTSSANEYPLNSDFYLIDTTIENKIAFKIAENLYKLSRIKSWLNIEQKNETERFPYSLALKNMVTKQFLLSSNVKVGEQYQLCLVRDSIGENPDTIGQRWIYVFAINSDGSINLLCPGLGGNNENHFPINPINPDDEIPIVKINVDPPAGINHIFYLTSATALPNPQMIEQEGITTRSIVSNPLENLITNLNARTRSVETLKAPETWSIQKIRFNIVTK